jgi:hypothetical protein
MSIQCLVSVLAEFVLERRLLRVFTLPNRSRLPASDPRAYECQKIVLFMTVNFNFQAPTKPNEYIQAIDSLMYDDEDTPDALAVAAKEKGNAAYTKGKSFHGNALRYYKEALDHCKRCTRKRTAMMKLESQVRCNIGAVMYERAKFWDVLTHCR